VVDRRRGCRFPGNQIPAAQLNPAAQKLLEPDPLPNQDGTTQELHTVLDTINTSTTSTCASCTKLRRRSRSGGA